MSLLGLFSAPVSAMMAQSKALESIGLNVANMNTGGYKRVETHFQTYLSNTYDYNRDIGGTKANTRQHVTDQGLLQSSDSNYDVAINGKGFFILNSSVDGSGDTVYGRDGQFQQELAGVAGAAAGGAAIGQTREGYLVDKNGYYLQGWPVGADGNVSQTLSSIRIDPQAYGQRGEATTQARIGLNVPGEVIEGYREHTTIQAYDSSGDIQSFSLEWTKLNLGNEWHLRVLDNGTPLELDTLDVADPATAEIDPVTGQPIPGTETSAIGDDLDLTTIKVVFNGDGSIASPTNLNIVGATNDANFNLDMTDITQFASNGLRELNYEKDGASDATMVGFEFTPDGTILGSFSDSTQRPIFKLPLANFTNADGLEPINGNVYRQSFESGAVTISEAGTEGFGVFSPFTHELSNVVLEDEFSRMMITQQAYNTSSTVFKTVDEMSQTARDLKG